MLGLENCSHDCKLGHTVLYKGTMKLSKSNRRDKGMCCTQNYDCAKRKTMTDIKKIDVLFERIKLVYVQD